VAPSGPVFGLGTAGGKVDGHATIISAILFLGLIVVECLLGIEAELVQLNSASAERPHE